MTLQESWVSREVGFDLSDPSGGRLDHLATLALRKNPLRAYLIVSSVLAKHVPADPRRVRDVARELGRQVADMLLPNSTCVVMGFAETATALGFDVAQQIPGSTYVHSTREKTAETYIRFVEGHSHAPDHAIDDRARVAFDRAEQIVLVDDELSTGNTALGVIDELVATTNCRRFIIASILDVRTASHHEEMAKRAEDGGWTLRFTTLALGRVTQEAGADRRAAIHVKAAAPTEVVVFPQSEPVVLARLVVPRGLDPRRPVSFDERRAAEAALNRQQAALVEVMPHRDCRLHLVGVEEDILVPLMVGELLQKAGRHVTVSSTTRSPVVVIDTPGYAVRTAVRYTTPDGERFAYNLPPDACCVIVVARRLPPDVLVEQLASGRQNCAVIVYDEST